MEKKKRIKLDPAIKAEIVKRAMNGEKVKDLKAEYKISSEANIYTWIKLHKEGTKTQLTGKSKSTSLIPATDKDALITELQSTVDSQRQLIGTLQQQLGIVSDDASTLQTISMTLGRALRG